jgi:hypothetical protein
MESSIAEFLKRQIACELLPTKDMTLIFCIAIIVLLKFLIASCLELLGGCFELVGP